MALTQRPPEVVFSWPGAAVLDPAHVLLVYNPLADEFVMAFGGTMRPAIVDPLDWTEADYANLCLDPESDEVVGVQLDHARLIAAAEHPTWKSVIEAAAVEPGLGPRRADRALWPEISAFIADVVRLSHT